MTGAKIESGNLKPTPICPRFVAELDVLFELIVLANSPVRVTEPKPLDVRRNRVLALPSHSEAAEDVVPASCEALHL